MKRFLVLLGLVAMAFVAWAVFAFRSLDVEDFGARLLQAVHQETGYKIEAGAISAHPFRGLELTDAVIEGRIGAGEFQVSIDRVRILHRILPLLWGRVVFDDIKLVNPQVEVTTRTVAEVRARRQQRRLEAGKSESVEGLAAEIPPTVTKTADSFFQSEKGYSVSIAQLEIVQGRVHVRSETGSEDNWSVEGVELALQSLDLLPATDGGILSVIGEGHVSTGRALFNDLEALRTAGDLRLTREAASFENLELQLASGRLTIADARLSLLKEPVRYRVKAEGVLDLNHLLQAADQAGFGPLNLAIAARGRGPAGSDLAGQGSLRLGAGSIPATPLTLEVESLLGRQLITGQRYPTTKIDFRLADDRLVLEPFEIVSDRVVVGGSGTVTLTGRLDLDLYVHFEGKREGEESGSSDPLKELVEGLRSVKVPLHVEGPIASPTVSLAASSGTKKGEDSEPNWLDDALEKAKKKAEEWLEDSDDN